MSNNLHDTFLAVAARQPEKTAIHFGDDLIPYGIVRERALAVSAALRRDFGVKPGDRVALWLKNRPEFVPAMFGILHAGGVVLPVNNFFKAEEVAHLLADGDVEVLITEAAMQETLAEVSRLRPGLRLLLIEDLGSLAAATAAETAAAPARGRGDLALLLYTSGTTGRPKGAMLTHGNLLANVASCRVVLEAAQVDRFVLMLPMFHTFMLTVCILLPLHVGAGIVLIRSLHPPKAMLGEIVRHGGSVLPAMAQVFRALSGLPPGLEIASLRLCISGAGPLPEEILRGFNTRFPDIALIEGYGLTEAAPVVSLNPVQGPWKVGSIGVPVTGVEISIRDDAGRELPDGHDGELWVRGDNVMAGYWRQPEASAAALRDGWLLTGDLGRRDPDGYLRITDRKKDMLKVNGINVYPREIEEVLYRFPGVKEAAVVGRPDPKRLEAPVAFVAFEEGRAADGKALHAFLREHLADYKVPRDFRVLPALPRNATGKILKTTLREMAKAEA
ncbi:MAG: AMP-binding protein [Limisphaerales bacterium]